jgi:hypothetical protein
MIDLETANRMFEYNPETGTLTRKIRSGKGLAGSVVGHPNDKGHLRVSIDYKYYYVHRICWLIHYGEDAPSLIDHKNGDGEDNKISNLRLATNKENSANMKLTSRNTSGVKGVSWHKHKGVWRATLKVDGKHVHVGYFEDIGAAEEAMRILRNKTHGEFTNHG